MKAAGVTAIALTVAPTQLASAAGVAATQGLDVPLIGNNPVFAPGLLEGPAAEALKEDLYIASPTTSLDAQSSAPGWRGSCTRSWRPPARTAT